MLQGYRGEDVHVAACDEETDAARFGEDVHFAAVVIAVTTFTEMKPSPPGMLCCKLPVHVAAFFPREISQASCWKSRTGDS